MATKILLAKELLPELRSEGAITKADVVKNVSTGGVDKVVDAEVIKIRDAEIQEELDAKLYLDDIQTPIVTDVGLDFSIEPDTPVLKLKFKNFSNQTESLQNIVVPLASPTEPGLMPSESVKALDDVRIRVSALEDGFVEFATNTSLSETATQTQIQAAFEAASGITGEAANTTRLVSLPTELYWTWRASNEIWVGPFAQSIIPFTNITFGTIKGENTDGKVYAEADGTGSLVGWSALKTRVGATENNLVALSEAKADKTSISTVTPLSSAAASNEKVYSEKLAFDQLAFKAGLADDNIFTGANKFDRTINGVTNELSLNETAWDIFVCRDTANPTRKTAIAKGYVWCQENDNVYGRFHSQNIYYGNDTVGYEGTLKFPAANIGAKYLVVTDNADGTLDSSYDIVIKTQAQFEALIADSTWFGAKSVALVGQFTLSTANNRGVKIPATVKQIHGFNSAKITITNFKYNSSTAKGGLWYATAPTTNDYSIRDLEVSCTGVSGHGFRNCINLSNCTGTGTGTNEGYGFFSCNNLSNCTGTGTGTGVYGCGFYKCNNLSNCTGTGTGSNRGYGFVDINYAVNCKDGGSKTAMWDGTNKNIVIDDSSAQTISGVKTFSVSPLVPTTPSGASAAVAKAYADSLRTVYDKVIRTQAEFEDMIADGLELNNTNIQSSTWRGAKSVALIGDQFTLSYTNNCGIKIPATVKQIHGFNSAKITITNFVYNSTNAKGGLWYNTLPVSTDYEIRCLEVNCTAGLGGTDGYGFFYCNNLSNCTGTGTGTYGFGFSNCNNLSNCTGTGTGTYGFGFANCDNLSNCTGTGTGTGTGTYGYGFSDIDYAVNCKDGGSSKNMWDGTNRNIDLDTCRETPAEASNTTLNT